MSNYGNFSRKDYCNSNKYHFSALINEDELLSKLKAEKFDLGITEPFNFCGFGKFSK